MSQPGGFDAEALLLAYCAGELTADEERSLFEAASRDQQLFDQLMEAESVRHALSFPEERGRAAAVLQAWEQHGSNVTEMPMPHGNSAKTRGHAALLGDGAPQRA